MHIPAGAYAVVFSSRRPQGEAANHDGYSQAADRMLELAAQQSGYLGVESARGADGFGITVSYWADEASIAAWRANAEHTAARAQGRLRWYEAFDLRIARVERSYAMKND